MTDPGKYVLVNTSQFETNYSKRYESEGLVVRKKYDFDPDRCGEFPVPEGPVRAQHVMETADSVGLLRNPFVVFGERERDYPLGDREFRKRERFNEVFDKADGGIPGGEAEEGERFPEFHDLVFYALGGRLDPRPTIGYANHLPPNSRDVVAGDAFSPSLVPVREELRRGDPMPVTPVLWWALALDAYGIGRDAAYRKEAGIGDPDESGKGGEGGEGGESTFVPPRFYVNGIPSGEGEESWSGGDGEDEDAYDKFDKSFAKSVRKVSGAGGRGLFGRDVLDRTWTDLPRDRDPKTGELPPVPLTTVPSGWLTAAGLTGRTRSVLVMSDSVLVVAKPKKTEDRHVTMFTQYADHKNSGYFTGGPDDPTETVSVPAKDFSDQGYSIEGECENIDMTLQPYVALDAIGVHPVKRSFLDRFWLNPPYYPLVGPPEETEWKDGRIRTPCEGTLSVPTGAECYPYSYDPAAGGRVPFYSPCWASGTFDPDSTIRESTTTLRRVGTVVPAVYVKPTSERVRITEVTLLVKKDVLTREYETGHWKRRITTVEFGLTEDDDGDYEDDVAGRAWTVKPSDLDKEFNAESVSGSYRERKAEVFATVLGVVVSFELVP